MAIERDKGYAWFVAASSTIIWFIGPSTFASYGRIAETVDLSYSYLIWILNTMYCLFFASAPCVVPLIRVCTHRKVALIGCLLAASGFLLSSSGKIQESPLWLFSTLSPFVGIGFGLAVHSTFLLVAFHFTKYRGLANGIGIVSSGLGYLLSPYLYEWAKNPKDRLHLRALTAAIAFMAASFYMSPPSRRSTKVEAPNTSRKSKGGKVKSGEDEGCRENEAFPRESIPLVGKYDDVDHHLTMINGVLRPRRKSQFMLAIAGTLMPNIPEESESQNHSMLNFSTITDQSESSVNNVAISVIPMKEEKRSEIGEHMQHLDLEVHLTKFKNGTDDFSRKTTNFPYVLPVNPNDGNGSVESVSESVNYAVSSKKEPIATPTTNPPEPQQILTCSKLHANVLGSELDIEPETKHLPLKSPTMSRKASLQMKINGLSSQLLEKTPPQAPRKYCYNFLSDINFKLLKNVTFLNMAFGSALTAVIVPNFPLILYAHVTQSSSQMEAQDELEMENNDTGAIVLLIIYATDLLSRLIISYLSDFSFFNRRIGFLCGALCGAIIIAGIGFIEDIHLIYALCVPYGVSFGVLVATESLMFADVFGIDHLPSAYGLVGILKMILILITSSVFTSPFPSFIYNVHPLWHWHSNAKMNDTICNNCDPFDLVSHSGNDNDISNRRYLFGLVASPGLICTLMWSIEILYTYFQARKCGIINRTSRQSSSSSQI